MDVNWFDFELPESLIAQSPLVERNRSRLMTLDKRTGEIGHYFFDDLIRFLQAGDTLVLNDTKVIPARLFGVKAQTGAKVEVLLLKNLGEDRWETLVKPGKRVKPGTRLLFGPQEEPVLTAEVESEAEMGERVLKFHYQGIFHEILDRLGQMPLPPYIKQQLEDKNRYQTVYAKHEGSAAAPTAGLHFTDEMLNRIAGMGISIAYLTLHVGLGTFRPVSVSNIEEHRMHAEYYSISRQTAEMLNDAAERGGRIIAVGTTSARTLETAGGQFGRGRIRECSGWTDIFIYPGYRMEMVDALLTNFHLPKSTLLMLISAFAGRENVLNAYREAVNSRYRFFSFGDAMFIY
ncbi:tRNA preQ1(34) S-adenosylmethionine ribosyltransferase-isomerase QueA [Ferviditalea candida]|uniref:S-adenosylmethionine:tRNA ribosyltransferase-isomerase n=1 Tax=Ferviditalea candida TaxID=3108399 RepID=A0ABU5ZIG4_9BACL|nr:tRNA preQ1(34) S-adenosylmethionine ribosyltransferase-isomerase QueA [Paenibacillaceae bacterium T2]